MVRWYQMATGRQPALGLGVSMTVSEYNLYKDIRRGLYVVSMRLHDRSECQIEFRTYDEAVAWVDKLQQLSSGQTCNKLV